MKMIRSAGIAVLTLIALGSLAFGQLVGTNGTNKQGQEQMLRVGGLECLANSATASGGAVTLNAAGINNTTCGTITTEALTTAAGSDYTLTFTNNFVASNDIIFASLLNGTNTGGAPNVRSITPATGSVVFKVRNGQSVLDSALNGTLKINFFIIKQAARNNN